MVTIPELRKAEARRIADLQGLIPVEPSLLPLRISTILGSAPNGADITMMCHDHNGDLYYCKADRDGRQIRATEWIATRLANHLGVVTAPSAVLENDRGETFFGSFDQGSSAGAFAVVDFLSTAPTDKNELGQPTSWVGQHLARLFVLDMFLNNPDRSYANFLLLNDGRNRTLCAIDFAAVRLADIFSQNFPVANSRTMTIGRHVRATHGAFPSSMIEMVDRIDAVPSETIRSIMAGMPEDWLANEDRERLCDRWATTEVRGRLSYLRAGIKSGALL